MSGHKFDNFGNAGGNAKVSDPQLAEMVRQYLEEGVSFRNLERTVLGIDSQDRGGGFVAKTALNSAGVTARKHKGVLKKTPIENLRASADGTLLATLGMVYGSR